MTLSLPEQIVTLKKDCDDDLLCVGIVMSDAAVLQAFIPPCGKTPFTIQYVFITCQKYHMNHHNKRRSVMTSIYLCQGGFFNSGPKYKKHITKFAYMTGQHCMARHLILIDDLGN